jgi:hypothetical protein
MSGIWQKMRRVRTSPWIRRGSLIAVGVVAAWLTLVVHPQPLFAHTLRRENIVLHARAPFPAEATAMLADVVRRVQRSPLYDATRVHDVFLCDTPALFAFFEPFSPRVGGITQVMLVSNVFIRPSNLRRNTVIGPSGFEKEGQRTLTYFIAHEVTHAMTADRYGRLRLLRLDAFQKEGYADYVAFDHTVDLVGGRLALASDAWDMSTHRSGLYKRYELLVAYLLERRHLSVDELLGKPMARAAVEHELLDAPASALERR